MMLSILTFSPLLFAMSLAFFPKGNDKGLRLAALGASLLNLALAVVVVSAFKSGVAGAQMAEDRAWLPFLGARYQLELNGISVYLVLLNALLTPVAILCSWDAVKDKVQEFHVLVLALQAAVYGVFLAADGFLFYLFWEFSLIPMYFLVGVWGGERRLYATMKFVLYTLAGSLLMLVAMLKLAFLCQESKAIGHISFALSDWLALDIAPETQRWLFLSFFVAFAIKVPLFPFHTWLPDAHVEAPTAGSVLLAGVLLKLGSFGLMRWCLPLFPEMVINYQAPVIVLSLISIVYGAGMVLVQTDFKKMVAYSSVSHMGVCMLGMFSLTLSGMQGSLLTMINHGVSTGALFVIVGIFYERTHTRDLAQYGGAVAKMPALGLLFLPVVMSSMGVPGTNGFVNEFLALRGAFRFDPMVGAVAATALVLGAAYMLRLTQKVMYGPLGSPVMEHLSDLNKREFITLACFVVVIFFTGIFPNCLLNNTEASVNQVLLEVMKAAGPKP